MTSLTLPYMIPLFLGMTYDARYSKPGVDIYESIYVDNPEIVRFGTTESYYSVSSTMSEFQNALDIDGELSLKIKTGMLDVEGKGSYLKNERDYKNKVEIITTLKYISSVHSFGPDAKPINNWSTLHSDPVLGTHYVSSITYGAEMIASARFTVHNANDTERVKAAVESEFQSEGNATNLIVDGALDKLNKTVSSMANLEISYYGTVPLRKVANTLDSLTYLITNFGEQIKETNLTDGIPMYVKLDPLTDIAPPDERSRFEFIKNKGLEDALTEFEEKFDELRQARLELSTWARGLPYELPQYSQDLIGKLIKRMTLVYEVFFAVLWSMDMTKDQSQLKRAFDAYDYDGVRTYRRYANQIKRLIYLVTPTIPKDEVSGFVYTQWGNNNCTAPDTVVLHSGFVFSSAEEGIGGTAKYECASAAEATSYDLNANSSLNSSLAGIHYTNFNAGSNPFKGPYAKEVPGKGVPCAKCYASESYNVAMFPATKSCPLTWNFMYLGYLSSARNLKGRTTKYICIDEKPSTPVNLEYESLNKDTVALTAVEGNNFLPPELFKTGSLVRCVVCSMGSNQVTF